MGEMRRRGEAAAFAVLVSMGLAAAPGLGASTTAARNDEIVRRMVEASERNDCAALLKLGVPMIERPDPTGLEAELEAFAYDQVVQCEAKANSNTGAYAHALKGTRLESASDYLWQVRLSIEIDEKRHEAAVVTIEAMMQGRGAALNSAPIQWMWQLHGELKNGGETALRRRLLKVLASDSYLPDTLYGPADGFRYEFAALLAQAREQEPARAVVATLATPSSLVRASLDSRLRHFLPEDLDVRAAAERTLKLHREAMARYPDRLQPLLLVVGDLRQLGQLTEALQLLQSAAGSAEQPADFTDLDDSLNWWWNELAYVHASLGHYDSAVAAFRKGAAADEGGGLNVSQVINLAIVQTQFGRGEDALKTLAVFDDSKRDLSPYGEDAFRLARGCAQAATGRPAEAAADVTYIHAHEKDAPGTLAEILLCLGDIDGAAAKFISDLDDPERSAVALLQLSDFDDPPVPVPEGPTHQRKETLKARADVKAAIARAGGIRRFRVQPAGI